METPAASQLIGRMHEGKRAILGGFAAMTPQQSGAATTSVIGTPWKDYKFQA